MDSEQIRSFIAIELPQEVKSGLSQLQAKLKVGKHIFVKWVTPEGIHLTLKFLGNVSAQKVADIARAMEQGSKQTAPFYLEIGNLGAFPNLRQPRVLWVGVGGDLDKLANLQQGIDAALAALGFARENRPFAPHLTLARLREGVPISGRRELGELVAGTPFETSYRFRVDSVNLMRSQLLPSGAVYSRLAEIKLAGL